ncbi:MAG: hypothetical protein GQ570_13430 [Helicobacteraceae bacterium]|nr:hypothetical protein [Helicobacteraceae bacterium]
MSFKLPLLSQEFFDEVETHCYLLIKNNYWDKIDNYTLKKWLENFKTDNEKYLASQILFHFQYRNEKAMLSMFKQIIQVYLPQKLDELGVYTIPSIREWEKMLSTDKAFKLPFRFSTIDKEDKIGTSGHALFRLYAQNNLIYKDIGRVIDSDMDDKVKTIIIVDDIIGSGEQFIKFYKKHKTAFEKFKNIIYCPLVAHEEGIANIKEELSHIHIVPAEVLTKEEHSFYSISDELNSNDSFQSFYQEVVEKLKIKFPLGFNEQAILYAMNISTPNNNLSVIYHNKQWNPFLKR